MKEAFIVKNFADSSLRMIAMASHIVEEYHEQGFILTLRQLYYQFIARDAFPEDRRWMWNGRRWVKDADGTKNADPNYKWLAGFINDARLAGLIDWSAIEDRTRNIQRNYHYTGPKQAVQDALDTYEIDMWANQPERVEVWIEKEALVGVIAKICDELDVPYFACRGYVSQSEQWRAAKRSIYYHRERGQETTILHLGDHDPSGIDMTRDNQDRQNMFCLNEGIVTLDRLALNWDQVEEYDPPPSPAKVTDSRWEKYVERFGDDSWELDALEPAMMAELIRNNVFDHRDEDLWQDKVDEREYHRSTLSDIINDLEED